MEVHTVYAAEITKWFGQKRKREKERERQRKIAR